MFTSEATTRGVKVQVQSLYIPERSDPTHSYYFFAYRIRISNTEGAPVKLLSRHWLITDANAQVQEVRGPGVVGEQPRLEEGQSFEYTSFCPLPTPVGSMRGTYEMTYDDGGRFEAQIAPFTLAVPTALN
jgi:ApaG protein